MYRLHHAWTLWFMQPLFNVLEPIAPRPARAVWGWWNEHILRPEEVTGK